jgi:cob(I)alamin adenosyltransferase
VEKASGLDSGPGMRIYTRTGDDGTTGLLYGGRVEKDGPGPAAEVAELLVRLQRELFVVGAELATAPDNRRKLTPGVSLVTAEMVEALEPLIDDLTARYDQPKEFVLPGENRLAAALDLARAVVRRAERASVAAARAGWLPEVSPQMPASHVLPYLNRLADLVYTMARWQEGAWRPVRVRPQP